MKHPKSLRRSMPVDLATRITSPKVGTRASAPPIPAALAPDPSWSGGDWAKAYAMRLVWTDLFIVVAAVFGAQLLWIDDPSARVSGDGRLSYFTVSIIVVVAWMTGMWMRGTRSRHIVGHGAQEYGFVLDVAFRLFGAIGIVSYLWGLDLSRGFILITFPVGTILLLMGRMAWRRWLHRARLRGRMADRAVLVGDDLSCERVARELERRPESGFVVVGRCDRVADLRPLLSRVRADAIILPGEDGLPPEEVRALTWQLEGAREQLIVAPALVDVEAPRLHARPIAGLPLIHVEVPSYTRGQRMAKRTFDVVLAAGLVLVLLPLFLVVACAVKLSDGGPVFYRQERVGRHGRPFMMFKFRSMRVGADAQLAQLLAEQGTDDTPLFKVQSDPRVTRVGAFLRRYSIDEVPQLFNVVLGDMSLVGPRPQREGEVRLYDDAARRRLIVKPGMSGLWQVSGRSSLSWDEAIRLDLFYVENWSVIGDIAILLRTFKAVISPGETAY